MSLLKYQHRQGVVGLLFGIMLWIATPAQAGLLADRLELRMYGRMGLAWTPSGDFILGQRLNLMGTSIGGRLEEGDYLEPTIALHILGPTPAEVAQQAQQDAPYVRMVVTPALMSRGLFLGVFSNEFADSLRIELFQAYVEAGNFLVPGLKLWGGARFYRGTDVHIADYYFFNNLTGQGVGLQYGGLDLTVLLHTSGNNPLYAIDQDGDGDTDERRQRTVFVGQYVLGLPANHALHALAELHLLPAARSRLPEREVLRPSDYGWVVGLKGHFALPNEGFNDISVRYGSGIANGSVGGAQTWNTFGLPNLEDRYDGAASVEVVDHLLLNINPLLGFNAYGILHYGRGASGTPEDETLDFALGARTTLYLSDVFHLVQDTNFQGVVKGDDPLATVVKLTLMPTLVPSGQRSVWARPHLRLIYTLGIYDQDAVDSLGSPYLQTVGPTTLGHYLGAQVEWWF
jgi:maltoporin